MNLTTPLECWREVSRFKVAVADAETVRESLELFTLKFDMLCSDTLPRCDDTHALLVDTSSLTPVHLASACVMRIHSVYKPPAPPPDSLGPCENISRSAGHPRTLRVVGMRRVR